MYIFLHVIFSTSYYYLDLGILFKIIFLCCLWLLFPSSGLGTFQLFLFAVLYNLCCGQFQFFIVVDIFVIIITCLCLFEMIFLLFSQAFPCISTGIYGELTHF